MDKDKIKKISYYIVPVIAGFLWAFLFTYLFQITQYEKGYSNALDHVQFCVIQNDCSPEANMNGVNCAKFCQLYNLDYRILPPNQYDRIMNS